MKKIFTKKTVSVVIPTWNEEGNILPLVQRLHTALTEARISYELIFIDDHSTDATPLIIRTLAERYPISFKLKKGKPGKAQSLIEGFSLAQAKIICMIDADLQYPPEAIPSMLTKLAEGSDIVVANRTERHVPMIRKFLSRSFSLAFGKVLHNLDVDVQSGLKVFQKKILADIKLQPTPWTFDMDFLVKARMKGYSISGVPIVFASRNAGEAKINLIRASWEIGLSAIKLKFLRHETLRQALTKTRNSAGTFVHNGTTFSPYSNLSRKESAFISFTLAQKIALLNFITLAIISFAINWHLSAIIVLAFLTSLYFIDLFFNFFLIYRSFTDEPEVTVNEKELDKSDSFWPSYTVFCPLYREWSVVPQFISAMSQLDYPKKKLQVMLLLEEDDTETIAEVKRMKLPEYFKTVIVPHALPKTKPKALNYGLQKATGEYVVVYDAEDVPDRDQLKKAVLAFQKTDRNTVCLQAKLNFYNPTQNILTRLFTAEYSLWFDLVLTGLQSITAPIPLGGTSNHFRIKDIFKLGGWDAFNVTEDCDLGTRLAKEGYNTAIFDSYTLEEANSQVRNWYAQRSRWIKGYIQTYFVHMRNPRAFFKNGKKSDLITFQFVVGGKILALFINPLMWLITASYFAFRPVIGPTIESLYLTPFFYMGVFSLVIGNFMYLYYYMVGCAKRGQEELIPYALLVPFYWLGMSIASWKALYEVIRKPHYWAKTTHGLHLTAENTSNKALQATEPRFQPGSVSLPFSPAFSE